VSGQHLRVFPRKTSYTPTDPAVRFGPPGLFDRPESVDVSVTFTWDIPRGEWLRHQWEMVCDRVRIGGPAFGDPGGAFVPGRYVREGVTITSRGCPCRCSFCYVPKREGRIRELETIHPGNVVNDNNLLACSSDHLERVWAMLRTQGDIRFPGGLDATRLKTDHIMALRGLSVRALWFAFDSGEKWPHVQNAIQRCREYWTRDRLRCYVLMGYTGDTIDEAEGRLRWVWDQGAIPFAMLYCDDNGKTRGGEWRRLQKIFARPAILRGICRDGRDWRSVGEA